MASYFVMSFIIWYGTNPWLACLIAVTGAIALQMCSMFLIVVCKIPDLLATCAMMFILDGLSLTYSGGGAISARAVVSGASSPATTEATAIQADLQRIMMASPRRRLAGATAVTP